MLIKPFCTVFVGLELIQHLRQQFGSRPTVLVGKAGSRTFAELEAASKQKGDERASKAKVEAEKAEQQRLDSLIPQVDQLWQLVHHLIERGQSKTYDEAVAHLMDLQAISELKDEPEAFDERIQGIEARFSRKRSLIARLKKAALI